MGMSLPACRWLCSRISFVSGVWEHRLVVGDGRGGEDRIMYGPFVNVLNHMAGPKVCSGACHLNSSSENSISPRYPSVGTSRSILL